jgi:hypothetical protein
MTVLPMALLSTSPLPTGPGRMNAAGVRNHFHREREPSR